MVISYTYLLIILLIWLLKSVHLSNTYLYEHYCLLLFQSRDGLIRGSNHIFARLRKFGLCVHVGRGNTASKTEPMCEAADTSLITFMALVLSTSVRSSSTWVPVGFRTPLLAYL